VNRALQPAFSGLSVPKVWQINPLSPLNATVWPETISPSGWMCSRTLRCRMASIVSRPRCMRQLLPLAADPVDPAVVYADLPVAVGHPAVRLSMIASLDGEATVDGLFGGLGGPADHRAPCLIGGGSRRILTGAPVGMTGFFLHMVCAEDEYLFLQLRRGPGLSKRSNSVVRSLPPPWRGQRS
jgi:hypothetical protein